MQWTDLKGARLITLVTVLLLLTKCSFVSILKLNRFRDNDPGRFINTSGFDRYEKVFHLPSKTHHF